MVRVGTSKSTECNLGKITMTIAGIPLEGGCQNFGPVVPGGRRRKLHVYCIYGAC